MAVKNNMLIGVFACETLAKRFSECEAIAEGIEK